MGQHRSFLLVALTAVIFGVVAEALGGAWPRPETIADLGAGLVLLIGTLRAVAASPESSRPTVHPGGLRMVLGHAGRL